MTAIEIKQQIDKNNQLIEELINPARFTLDKTIFELQEDNNRLSKMCPHEYENGFCIYCYMKEPHNES